MSTTVEVLFGGILVLCFEGQANCPILPDQDGIHQNTAYVLATKTGEPCRHEGYSGYKVCKKCIRSHWPEIVYLQKSTSGKCPKNCRRCKDLKCQVWPCTGDETAEYCRCSLPGKKLDPLKRDICLQTTNTEPTWTRVRGRGDTRPPPRPRPTGNPRQPYQPSTDSIAWLGIADRMDHRARHLQRNRLEDDDFVAFRFHFNGGNIATDRVWRFSDVIRRGSKDHIVWSEGQHDPSPMLPRALAQNVRMRMTVESANVVYCGTTESIIPIEPINGQLRLGVFNYLPPKSCAIESFVGCKALDKVPGGIPKGCDSKSVEHFRWYYQLTWPGPADRCPADVVVPLYPGDPPELEGDRLESRYTVFCPPAGG